MVIRTRENAITILDLCAGTGMFSVGVELALEAVGLRGETVGYVERESCAASSIVARVGATPACEAPVWDDVRSIDVDLWRGKVGILTAGYPCQPFSTSGKRRGESDPRHLWPSIRGAIAGIEPGIVFLENVSGHVSSGAGNVICDLRGLDYTTTCGLFSSAEVGASHRRERLFILGNADMPLKPLRQDDAHQAGAITGKGYGTVGDAYEPRLQGRGSARCPHEQTVGARSVDLGDADSQTRRGGQRQEQTEERRGLGSAEAGTAAADTGGDGKQGAPEGVPRGDDALAVGDRDELPRYAPARNDYRAWAIVAGVDPARMPAIESEVRRISDGLAPASDQLRLAGNGVCPLVAAYAFITLSACLAE